MSEYHVCKICVSLKGLQGAQLGKNGYSFLTPEELYAHYEKEHKMVITNMPENVRKKVDTIKNGV